ncbi:hypothetical protein C3L33_06257, partial [Rhododendron williamsianum]
MSRSGQNLSAQNALSSSPRSREWEGPARWTEYLGPEMTSPLTSRRPKNAGSEGAVQSSGGAHKGLNMQWLYQLTAVAEGLMAKMYRLNQILDYPDSVGNVFSEAFWKAGLFPNHPKICILLSKKFPEHHSKLQLERVDKVALDALNDSAEVHFQSLEPWVQLLLDLMAFREQALRLILDLSSTVITLLCIRLNRLVQFVDSYDPPLKGLQEDLNFVSPRIGERAQDLANVTSYREWVLFGYLVCPDELLRVTSIDIALFYVLPRILESKKMAKSGRTKQKEADLEYSVAKQVEKMIRNEEIVFNCHFKIVHNIVKDKSSTISYKKKSNAFEHKIFWNWAILLLMFGEGSGYDSGYSIISERAYPSDGVDLLSLVAVCSVSRPVKKNLTLMGLNCLQDPSDPTIGFLLDGMDHLCCLVRKYIAAIRGYALSYLSSCAGRIRFLLGTPGMVALDLDATLKRLFQQIVQHLENIPKPQGDTISAITCDLSELRKDWLSMLMIVTSARSSINIRHLEKATVSTGKEGLLSEGNAAYNWSRCVDELESQLSKHGSLKKLYFYHQHLTTVPSELSQTQVFRNTMFGPEGRPQHCCAWLGVASSFPECASAIVPEEVTKIGRDAVLYVESLIESIMGGLEGLINILDSEGGFGSLEMQLLPEQAATLMNLTSRVSIPSVKSPKVVSGFHFPGYESYPENNGSIKMLEAAMQRLTNLCSVLNDMEPICVLNHVFVLREYMRECILGNFKRKLLAVLKLENDLQRPSVLESLIRRHISIVHLAEQHISMDLTQGIREVLLTEAFSGPVSSLHLFDKPLEQHTGSAVDAVCNWYVENIVKDLSGAGIQFAPLHRCFKSTGHVGGYFAESVTDVRELQAFVRMFGGYGVDRLDRMMKERTAALLNCIDSSLRANRDVIEAVAGSMHCGDRIEAEANMKQIIDVETVVGFCVQAGQAMAFDCLLAEAAGAVLEEGAPLIHSLLSGVVDNLPDEIPEKKEIRRLRRVANGVGVINDHDTEWIRSILEEVGGANDGSWTCICAVIAGSEFVRLEKEHQQRQPFPNGHASEILDLEIQNHLSAETSVKSAMQLFVKFSAGIILDSWTELDR